MFGQPDGRRRANQIATAEDRLVDLRLELRRITAIDKNHRLRARHQRNAGGTGKARQPGQALGALRHIFPLIFIGARHQKTVDTKGIETGAQRLDAGLAKLRRRFVFEGLEHGRLSGTVMEKSCKVRRQIIGA